MIAADTSTWIAFLEGSGGEDTQLLDKALADHRRLAPADVKRNSEGMWVPPAVRKVNVSLGL